MKINSSTELMKNQKHAVVMGPAAQFEVLQTQSGNSLFFSIGTDGVFYLTRENPTGTTGWDMQDLSTQLSSQFFNEQNVTAKCFDIAQDLTANTTDIALVVTVGGSDYLFVSLGNINTDQVWAANRQANTISFTEMTFDDTTHSFTGLAIADVSLVESGTTEYLIADIIVDPTNPTQVIYRYFVDPTKKVFGKYWNPHDISNNLSAGAVTNKLGRKSGQPMDGVYTMGQILGIPQLVYTPLYTITKKGSPDPTVFTPPAGATAMALSVPKAPYTDLFVAANGGLYYLSYTSQLSGTTPALIYSHALLQGVESLHVNNTTSQTIVWGLNEQGLLFYMSCAAGSEANTSAWSYPVAILAGVENVATYIHNSQNNLVIFAHMDDDSTLVQLTKDPTSTHWAQRSILLPSTDPDDMIERYTFTTHIELTDDNNVALQSQTMIITPTAACSVYINDVYCSLYANVPFQFPCDILGEITIVQAIDSLAGISFSITDGVMPTPVIVNPFDNILDKINPSRDPNVQVNLNTTVKDEMGNQKNLVDDPNVSQTDIAAMEQYITQFLAIASATPPQVPPDGTQQPDAPATGTPASVSAAPATSGEVFGIQQKDGHFYFYNSVEQAIQLGVQRHVKKANTVQVATANLLGSDDEIEVLAGDGWNWLKHAFEDVVHFEIDHFGGINHFFFTIAEQTYHFALKATHDIANGIHFVLNKIKVAFEDMIKWLGSIFAWIDIINTHKVLYQLFLKFGNHCVGNLSQYSKDVENLAQTIDGMLSNWADLPTDSQNSASSSDTSGGQRSTPSSKWGTNHLKSNGANSNSPAAGPDPTSLIQVLIDAVVKEGEVISDAGTQLEGVFNKFSSMSGEDLVKAIVAILAEAFVNSAENVITALIEALIALLTNIEDTLTETIKIPVISKVYKTFTGSDLSILDLVCLLVAIPATVIYKLANNNDVPFTADDVAAFTNAVDFNAIADLCFDDTVSANLQLSAGSAAMQLLGDTPAAWPPAELQNQKNKTHHIIQFTGNMAALVGGSAMAIFGGIKAVMPATTDSKILAWLTGIFYFPYIGPDITAHVDLARSSKKGYDVPGYVYWNSVFSALGLTKAFMDIYKCKGMGAAPDAAAPVFLMAEPADDGPADNGGILPDPEQGAGPAPADQPAPNIAVTDTSVLDQPAANKINVPEKGTYDFIGPVTDLLLNAIWEGPVLWVYFGTNANKKDLNNILNFVGNSLFNISGVLSPLCSWGVGPTKLACTLVAAGCNFGYAAMSAAMSLDADAIEN